MRKGVLLVVTAATAMLAVLPMAAASSATTPDVLTINSAGGPNVAVNAILKANLQAGSKASFVNPADSTQGVFCSKGTVSDKVSSNPLKPGTAVESLTAQTFSSCTTTGLAGATVSKVVIQNLPYTTKISDGTGFPLTVSKPGSVLKTSLTLTAFGQTFTCTYTKASIKGNASNTGSTNAFKKQVFTNSPANSLCLAKGSFSATFGPLLDFSVGTTTHPKVFVN